MKNKNGSTTDQLQKQTGTPLQAPLGESLNRPGRRVQKFFTGPSRTKQSFKDECDINKILAKVNKTGQLPDLIKQNPKYGDFSEPKTYQESLNVILHANEQFANLSSRIRDRFNNSPQNFLEFTADPNNIDEMVKLGLAVKRQSNQNNDEQPKDQQTDQIKNQKDQASDSK